ALSDVRQQFLLDLGHSPTPGCRDHSKTDFFNGIAPSTAIAGGIGHGSGWVASRHLSGVSEVALFSHSPRSPPVRGAGHATPRFHNVSRWRDHHAATRGPRAAESDARDRLPQQPVARPECTLYRRISRGAE